MNRKIDTTLAIAIIIVFTVTIGGTICFGENRSNQKINQVTIPSNTSRANHITNDIADESQNNSVNWLSYRYDKFKVEYSYPSDWIKGGDDPDAPRQYGKVPEYVYKKSTTQSYPDPSYPLDAKIGIGVMANDGNLSLQEIFKRENDKCLEKEKKDMAAGRIGGMGCPGYPDVSKWKKIMVDGKPALQTGKHAIEGGAKVDEVYIQLPGKFLTLRAVYYNENYSNQLMDIFDKFISTFKFIK
ncbi:MAG: hypothetical protein WC823_04725 [Parcubacteria group bacterium]|jgi:hypothetical protein